MLSKKSHFKNGLRTSQNPRCKKSLLGTQIVFKDAVLSILATIAKQERIRLSERTMAGLEKARKQGRVGGRPRLIVNRDELARLDSEGLTMERSASSSGFLRPRSAGC